MADPSTCLPLCSQSIERAHSRITQYVDRTPLLTSRTLDEIASSSEPRAYLSETHDSHATERPPSTNGSICPPKFQLYFKAENLQRGGAFKARGAFFALQHLIEIHGLAKLQRTGVVTHSSGNHAQALALAASVFDVPAYIVMPRNATKSKIEGARRYAKEIVFAAESTSFSREATMEEVKARTNAVFVPPFDHFDIILGQGTVGKEMAEQLQETQDGLVKFDAVMVPLGGGGLLAGVATWFSDTPVKVFGCEPSFEGADDAKRGRALGGERIENVNSLTIADGLRMPVGSTNWDVVADSSKVEDIYSVGEEEIKMAMRLVFERLKMVVEPSACVPLAVLLFNKDFRATVSSMQEQQAKETWKVGVILSGGNTTMEKIAAMFGTEDGRQ